MWYNGYRVGLERLHYEVASDEMNPIEGFCELTELRNRMEPSFAYGASANGESRGVPPAPEELPRTARNFVAL